ncbi:hypothetical protein WR25_22982 [Diploscapter pachys]|uniref:Uncharacterized protein n=1 Tax=Diploscapter pachys TaxID=2018661 RepID=A0A2A2JLT1_9BILA|nr:hypothetical protein WR25_22982 [Diploscapter pachys]
MTSFGNRNRSDGNPFKLVKSLSTTFFFNRHKEYSTNLGEKKIALDDTLRDVKCSMKLEESRARKDKERFSKTAHGNRMARLFSPPPAPGRNVGFASVYGNVDAPPTLRSGSRSLIPSASTSQVPSSAQYSPFLPPRHRRMSATNDQNSEDKVGEKLGSSGNNSGERQGQLGKVEKTPEKVATAPENAVEEKSDKDKETEVRDILLDASKKLHSVSRVSKKKC